VLAAHALAAACLYHSAAVTLVLQKLQASAAKGDFFAAAHAAFILGETGCRGASVEDLAAVVNALAQLLSIVAQQDDAQIHVAGSHSSYAAYYACEALGICMSSLIGSHPAPPDIRAKVTEALAKQLDRTRYNADPMPRISAGLAFAKLAPWLLGPSASKVAVDALKSEMRGDDRYASYHALTALTRSCNSEAHRAAIAFLMEQRWCSFTSNGRPY